MSTSKTRAPNKPDPVGREILLGFWKVHILHHAGEEPVYGQWIAEELRRHGFKISPGTLYPLLQRMERHGWLERAGSKQRTPHARREYRLSRRGARLLAQLRILVAELYREVVAEARPRSPRGPRKPGRAAAPASSESG